MSNHVLISNDDGVHAPGIMALRKRLLESHRVTVIAPLEERSTTGHSLSLDKPLRLETFGDEIYGCTGFPGDCVLMGLGHVLKNDRPAVVMTGINRGANLGQDLYYSGTIAAAREAAFHHVPSIAMSLVFRDFANPHPAYDTAAQVASWLLNADVHKTIAPLTLLNVNVPDCPIHELKGIRVTSIGFRRYSEEVHERIDSRGRPYYWIAGLYEGFNPAADSDCQAIEENFISVTPQVLVSGSHPDWSALKSVIGKIHVERFA